MVYIHTGLLLSHKKEHVWVSSDEVDEPTTYIIQSEVNQKEKDVYCILMHIYTKSRKMVIKNLYSATVEKQI